MTSSGDTCPPKYIWDIPTRIFHWGLVISVAGAFISGKAGMMDIHERFGLTILGLIGFRIIWGMAGFQTAKFSQFLTSPVRVLSDALSILKATKTKAYHGHSPLGGYASLALLAVPALLALTGLFSTNDILFDGPLAHLRPEWMQPATKIHHLFHPVMIALIVLHVTAMLVYWLRLRINLVPAMFTGTRMSSDNATGTPESESSDFENKQPKPTVPSPAAQITGIFILLSCLGLAHSLVWLRPSWF